VHRFHYVVLDSVSFVRATVRGPCAGWGASRAVVAMRQVIVPAGHDQVHLRVNVLVIYFSLFTVGGRVCRCAVARSRWHGVAKRSDICKSATVQGFMLRPLGCGYPCRINKTSGFEIRERRTCV